MLVLTGALPLNKHYMLHSINVQNNRSTTPSNVDLHLQFSYNPLMIPIATARDDCFISCCDLPPKKTPTRHQMDFEVKAALMIHSLSAIWDYT